MRPPQNFDARAITHPHERLLTYYFIVALLSLVAFPVTMTVLYIKYRTMRFRFDDEGVWKRQGLLWRREVNVAYRRIQDIHLTSGIIQRWLGLATVSIQTAAGSSTAEVTIEGVLEADALRDYLYTKMRGVRESTPVAAHATESGLPAGATDDEALALLVDIRDSLRRLETRLSGRP
ncbi:MAG TPA: PH domain-containing protein [Vicinamibacterales bacterium]|nr:PH domain-containing protein [Vicinamibacterales bacterium]